MLDLQVQTFSCVTGVDETYHSSHVFPTICLYFPYFPGLETFSSHPLVLSSLDKLAVGKILLMEALEPCQQGEMPVVVLYDTSQDDDVNINSTCLKALQDKTMNNPLTVRMVALTTCVV